MTDEIKPTKCTECDFGLYEIMDRTHAIETMIAELVDDHEVLDRHQELKESVQKVTDAIYHLYQHSANLWHESRGRQ